MSECYDALPSLEGLGLSEGWTRVWDGQSRSFYFAKPETGEAQWEEPPPPQPPEPPPPPSPEEGEEVEGGATRGGEEGEEGKEEAADPAVIAPDEKEWVQLTTAKAAPHPDRLAVMRQRAALLSQQKDATARESMSAHLPSCERWIYHLAAEEEVYSRELSVRRVESLEGGHNGAESEYSRGSEYCR